MIAPPNDKANLPGPPQGHYIARNENAAQVKLSDLFGVPFRNHLALPNSLWNNSSALAFPSSVTPTDLFLLTGSPM